MVDRYAFSRADATALLAMLRDYRKQQKGQQPRAPVIAGGYKPLVRFTLDNALATSEASETATITDQYGVGVDNTTASGGITVYNLETSTASTYVFEGDSGDAGLAIWDSGTNYRIVQMECP